ncbi:MAG: DUF2789 family protein [Granulosicoccaceae bacterium]
MDTAKHNLANRFLQLGLSADIDSIDAFIDKHSVDDGVSWHNATFWTKPQAQFIIKSRDDGADWSQLLDKLDTTAQWKRFKLKMMGWLPAGG